jgi:hypothetical protein
MIGILLECLPFSAYSSDPPRRRGDYAVRRNNLHNFAGHSYTGQKGIYDIVTPMVIEEIDLCI